MRLFRTYLSTLKELICHQNSDNLTRNGSGVNHFEAKSSLTTFYTLTHQISLFASLHTLSNLFHYKTQKTTYSAPFNTFCTVFQFSGKFSWIILNSTIYYLSYDSSFYLLWLQINFIKIIFTLIFIYLFIIMLKSCSSIDILQLYSDIPTYRTIIHFLYYFHLIIYIFSF